MKRKIILAGGSGFLGDILIKHFQSQFQIVVLTRQPNQMRANVHMINWDATTLNGWEKELEGCYAVINLTGKSVNCRYTETNKQEILNSRINSTQVLNQAILSCKEPPVHFINSSTATIYIDSREQKMTEYYGTTGDDFSMTVAKKWEQEFFNTPTPRTRKTVLRTGFVLGKHGGALPTLKTLASLGFGGKQGDGEQLISWIHELDFARAIDFILTEQITEVVNLVAPNPVTNQHFMKSLRQALQIPIGIPIPKCMLQVGACVIGTEPELVLKSRFVYPQVLLSRLFVFQYPTINNALISLMI